MPRWLLETLGIGGALLTGLAMSVIAMALFLPMVVLLVWLEWLIYRGQLRAAGTAGGRPRGWVLAGLALFLGFNGGLLWSMTRP